MHRSIKILAPILALAAVARMAWLVQFEGSQEALERRFPHVDPSIVRQVHSEMTREFLRGEHEGIDSDDDDALDAIFWEKVAKIYSEA